jgi:hypothetical protein
MDFEKILEESAERVQKATNPKEKLKQILTEYQNLKKQIKNETTSNHLESLTQKLIFSIATQHKDLSLQDLTEMMNLFSENKDEEIKNALNGVANVTLPFESQNSNLYKISKLLNNIFYDIFAAQTRSPEEIYNFVNKVKYFQTTEQVKDIPEEQTEERKNIKILEELSDRQTQEQRNIFLFELLEKCVYAKTNNTDDLRKIVEKVMIDKNNFQDAKDLYDVIKERIALQDMTKKIDAYKVANFHLTKLMKDIGFFAEEQNPSNLLQDDRNPVLSELKTLTAKVIEKTKEEKDPTKHKSLVTDLVISTFYTNKPTFAEEYEVKRITENLIKYINAEDKFKQATEQEIEDVILNRTKKQKEYIWSLYSECASDLFLYKTQYLYLGLIFQFAGMIYGGDIRDSESQANPSYANLRGKETEILKKILDENNFLVFDRMDRDKFMLQYMQGRKNNQKIFSHDFKKNQANMEKVLKNTAYTLPASAEGIGLAVNTLELLLFEQPESHGTRNGNDYVDQILCKQEANIKHTIFL